MGLTCIRDGNLEETGFSYTMSLIQGKYKMFILYALMGYEVVRFNELKKDLAGISQKVLTDSLRSMEADGLIVRTVYPEVPLRVEYGLSELGEAMRPIIAPAVIITVFTTFKQFDVVYLLTQQAGAKTGSGFHTILTYAYENAFITNNYGYSSAISMIIFALLLLFSAKFQLKEDA